MDSRPNWRRRYLPRQFLSGLRAWIPVEVIMVKKSVRLRRFCCYLERLQPAESLIIRAGILSRAFNVSVMSGRRTPVIIEM